MAGQQSQEHINRKVKYETAKGFIIRRRRILLEYIESISRLDKYVLECILFSISLTLSLYVCHYLIQPGYKRMNAFYFLLIRALGNIRQAPLNNSDDSGCKRK
ncbi:hypothetical protein CBL_03771 [Carabus blaptoides fortunei]